MTHTTRVQTDLQLHTNLNRDLLEITETDLQLHTNLNRVLLEITEIHRLRRRRARRSPFVRGTCLESIQVKTVH